MVITTTKVDIRLLFIQKHKKKKEVDKSLKCFLLPSASLGEERESHGGLLGG